MYARVPASTANLGPGFDTLAIALNRYTSVRVEEAPSLEITTVGEGSEFPSSENHLAARVARMVLGHCNVRISIQSDIPVSRGLGSSAALAVGVAAACGAADPLTIVGLLEGHADNAAAAVLGGFVTGAIIDSDSSGNANAQKIVAAQRLPLDPELVFVGIVPARDLETKQARAVLPPMIPRGDAVFNLGRMGQMIGGLADHRQLMTTAGQDRLHQNYRTDLYPESVELLRSLTEGGALVSFWSGAGPSLMSVCLRDSVDAVQASAARAMETVGMAGTVELFQADTVGVVVEP